jgi:hypothetical protein
MVDVARAAQALALRVVSPFHNNSVKIDSIP